MFFSVKIFYTLRMKYTLYWHNYLTTNTSTTIDTCIRLFILWTRFTEFLCLFWLLSKIKSASNVIPGTFHSEMEAVSFCSINRSLWLPRVKKKWFVVLLDSWWHVTVCCCCCCSFIHECFNAFVQVCS